MVSVGALNPDGSVALFSNSRALGRLPQPGRGAGQHAAGWSTSAQRSGVDLGRRSRDRQVGSWRATIDPDSFTGFGTWSGTSFAAPVAAGSGSPGPARRRRSAQRVARPGGSGPARVDSASASRSSPSQPVPRPRWHATDTRCPSSADRHPGGGGRSATLRTASAVWSSVTLSKAVATLEPRSRTWAWTTGHGHRPDTRQPPLDGSSTPTWPPGSCSAWRSPQPRTRPADRRIAALSDAERLVADEPDPEVRVLIHGQRGRDVPPRGSATRGRWPSSTVRWRRWMPRPGRPEQDPDQPRSSCTACSGTSRAAKADCARALDSGPWRRQARPGLLRHPQPRAVRVPVWRPAAGAGADAHDPRHGQLGLRTWRGGDLDRAKVLLSAGLVSEADRSLVEACAALGPDRAGPVPGRGRADPGRGRAAGRATRSWPRAPAMRRWLGCGRGTTTGRPRWASWSSCGPTPPPERPPRSWSRPRTG